MKMVKEVEASIVSLHHEREALEAREAQLQ